MPSWSSGQDTRFSLNQFKKNFGHLHLKIEPLFLSISEDNI